MAQRPALKLWLRLEVFEHGILHFPSRYNACLTYGNVQKVMQAISTDCVTQLVSYGAWKEAAEDVFQWHEIEYKTFWDTLLFFHDLFLQRIDKNESRKSLNSADQFVPKSVLAMFLFIHTDKPTHFRTKETLEAYNAVWYQDAIPSAEQEEEASSPHAIGLKHKSMADVHFLSFMRENLDHLIQTVFPEASCEDQREHPVLTFQDIDSMGFLFAAVEDSESLLHETLQLSRVFPWEEANSDTYMDTSCVSVVKLTQWIQTFLGSNETLYPPLGLSSAARGSWPAASDSMKGEKEILELQRPVVINFISKSTLIKQQPCDFESGEPQFDILLYDCHDSFIYLLTPVRHVNIVACSNCVIAVGPARGVISLDRCEKVRLSAPCELLRVSNSFDSVFNIYSRRSPVLMGDNRGIQLGPYNSFYPTLSQHMLQVGIELPVIELDAQGHSTGGEWCNFINLNIDDDQDGSEKEAVILQPPSTFTQLTIPVQDDQMTTTSCPVPLPPEYAAAVAKRLEVVEKLRTELLENSEIETNLKHDIESALASKFKEWLVSSGNMRQIMDLVQLQDQEIIRPDAAPTSSHAFSTPPPPPSQDMTL